MNNFFRKNCNILFLSVFFLSFFLTNIFKLPIFGTKFQITEILFFLSIPFFPIKKILELQLKHNKIIFIMLFFLIILQFISSLISGNSISIVSTFGRLYLLFLFSFFYYFINIYLYNSESYFKSLDNIFFSSIIFIAILALFGFFQFLFHNKITMYSVFENYPYFGTVYRLKGFNTHPNMLANLLIFIILYCSGKLLINDNQFKIYKLGLTIIAFGCLFLTFSKSIIILIMGLLAILYAFHYRFKKIIFTLIISSFTILYIFITHIIIAPKNTQIQESLKTTNFTSDKILFTYNQNVLIETCYLCLKRIELNVIKNNLFFGVGNGRFYSLLDYYKRIGLYPKKLPVFDPHCTYLGLFAENGLIAFILFMAFIFYIIFLFVLVLKRSFDKYIFLLFVIYLTFLIEAVSTDILNYRHFWFFLSIILVVLNNTIKRNIILNDIHA